MTDITGPLWPALLSAALVGTDRRSPAGITVPPALAPLVPSAPATGTDVLTSAAAITVARRAGLAATTGLAAPAPADTDPRPLPSEAARSRLRGLIAEYHNAPDPLHLWLRIAADRGVRAPERDVADLLRLGRRTAALRPAVLAVAGTRGAWLAAQLDEWRWAIGADPAAAPDESAWTEGTLPERVAFLASVRSSDPGRASNLLGEVWASEPPAERAAFIEVLADGLGPADAAFLESALDDRRKEIRLAAIRLARAVSGSAYQQRMAARAHACVTRTGRKLAVTPPAACDDAMKRDGIEPKPPTGVGERTWWLDQIVAATPLSAWSALGTPEELAGAKVAEDWAPWLHRSWARAAAREQDPVWAAALLDHGFGRTAKATIEDRALAAQLLRTFPPETALARMDALLHGASTTLDDALALIEGGPAPLPDTFVPVLLTYLGEAIRKDHSAYLSYQLRSIGRTIVNRLPPEAIGEVRAFAAKVRPADGSAATLIDELVATATIRYEILQEFA